MAEYFYGNIKIGGKITKEQQYKIVEILEVECQDLEVDSIDQLKDFIVEEVAGNFLFFEFNHLPYGEFEVLEEFLKKNEIPFKSFSEASFEFAEQRTIYNPQNSGNSYPRTIMSVYSEEVLYSKDLVKVLNKLQSIEANKTYELIPEVISHLMKEIYPNTEIPPVILEE